MASKIKASTALFLCISLLFFASVSSYTPNASSTANSRNPVYIRPGATYPSGYKYNPQGQGRDEGRCNPLNLGVCANLLGLVNIELGNVPTQPCCSLIQGLVDIEAAVCLCTAIRANVLGINLNLPIDLSLLLNNCGRTPSAQYMCSS
ncbi:hypothetical protein DITRI_Ditri09bG0064500 [Diplodiscus trichospermus]